MITENRNIPQVIVAQVGARRKYAVPVLLHRAGILAHLYTDTYVGPGSAWQVLTKIAPMIPGSWQSASFKRLLTRREDSLPGAKVTAFNLIGYQLARNLRKTRDLKAKFDLDKKYWARFCRQMLRHADFQGEAVYAFNAGAGWLFEATRPKGLKCLHEQVAAPAEIMHQLYREEHDLWPEWEGRYTGDGLRQAVGEMECYSWTLADRIFCPSDFVRQGLISQGVEPKKIRLVPYGVETNQYAFPRDPWDGRRPLRLLFVGGVTIRKGVHYFCEALRLLDSSQFEARMVGPVMLAPAAQAKLSQVTELTGQVPRTAMHRHYEWADLFVFPSISEGSAAVVYEALNSGLPVITTPNAGSVVRDGVDGYIVPIRNPEAIAARLETLVKNPDLIREMSCNARKRSRDFSWENYEERLVTCIKDIFEK
jgi:glycosyltransferase involved in cell wall biosynthesis